jgi:hypothetical protein
MRTITRTLLPLILLATTAAVAADKAADKNAAQAGAGKSGGKYMTRDELRSCMGQKEQLAGQNADALKERAALTDVKDALAKSGDELKQALETLDRTNAEAVDAFNEKTRARDKEIDAYQVRVEAFNHRVNDNKAKSDAYQGACENRRYFEEDEIAIKKGK